jgi:photosystem II stability/assembly factor-like uncharacterized protein
VVIVVVVAMLTSACSALSDHADQATPSTLAPGSPWLGNFTGVALPVPVNSLTALACATATSCWAVGSTVGDGGAPNGAAIIATKDGGAHWVNQAAPGTVSYLSGISCSDRRHCTAVGQTADGQAAIVTTTDGGKTWTQVTAPPGILDASTVSCLPSGRCIAVGSSAGGLTALVSASALDGWVAEGALPTTISNGSGLSCTDTDDCWVAGYATTDGDHGTGAVALTTDGGSTWSPVVTPAGIGYLSAVSCLPGPTAGGALPFTTTTAPTSSSVSSVASTGSSASTAPTTTVPPTTTTTPATTTTTAPVGVAGVRCTVVGTTSTTLLDARSGHAVVLTSDNGGAVWSSQQISTTAATFRDVSCPAVGSCVAVGSSVSTSPTAGMVVLTGSGRLPWRHTALVGAPQPLLAVSCTSRSRCIVVGESISEHLSGA